MNLRCEVCGEGVVSDPDLPDSMCWDRRAEADQIDLWVAKALEHKYGEARHRLKEVGDERAGDALRAHLGVADPWVLAYIIEGLGWSGAPTDGPLLAPLLRHDDEFVREAARSTLTELEVPGAADLLTGLLDDIDAESREVSHVQKCLSWLAGDRPLPVQPFSSSRPRFVLEPLGERVVPRLAMTAFVPETPPGAGRPPAKFLGQPDWRGDPAWPVGGDGRLLMFYGQLPLPGPEDRTAYIFLAGPDESRPLGPGNAVVVQPGGPCHLPTRQQAIGPQAYDWVCDTDRFRLRCRRFKADERFVVLEDGADPLSWEWAEPPAEALVFDEEGSWSKIGGTALWLQGEESPPGDGWRYAFQFSADPAGGERADGAICYGWTRADGTAAFGWQCH